MDITACNEVLYLFSCNRSNYILPVFKLKNKPLKPKHISKSNAAGGRTRGAPVRYPITEPETHSNLNVTWRDAAWQTRLRFTRTALRRALCLDFLIAAWISSVCTVILQIYTMANENEAPKNNGKKELTKEEVLAKWKEYVQKCACPALSEAFSH